MNNRILFSLLILSTFSTKIIAELRLPGYYINKENDTIKTTFIVPYGIQLNTGVIITKEKVIYKLDTIDFIKITYSIKIIDEKGKHRKLKAKNIKSFHFIYKNDEYDFVSYTTEQLGNYDPTGRYYPAYFLRVLSHGKCNLYCYYEKIEKGNGGGFMPMGPSIMGPSIIGPSIMVTAGINLSSNYNLLGKNYYLKLENQPLIPLFNEDNFKNQIFEYFNNCEELRDLVYKTDLKRRDIKLVVDRYNDYCK